MVLTRKLQPAMRAAIMGGMRVDPRIIAEDAQAYLRRGRRRCGSTPTTSSFGTSPTRWGISPGDDLTALAADVLTTVRDFALPAIEAHLPVAARRDIAAR